MSHCCKLRCLFVISCVHFTLNGVTSQLHRCFIAAHRGGFVLPKMSNCFSLLWLLDISGVLLSLFGLLQVTTGLSLSLMGLVFCHLSCCTTTPRCDSVPSHVFQCLSLGWLKVTPGFWLLHTEVVSCGLRYHIVFHFGGFAWIKLSHCFLHWQLSVISCDPLPLTAVVSCQPRCFTSAHWGGSVTLQESQCW